MVGKPLPPIGEVGWHERGTIVDSEPVDPPRPDALNQIGRSRNAVYGSLSAWDSAGTEISGTYLVPGQCPDKVASHLERAYHDWRDRRLWPLATRRLPT